MSQQLCTAGKLCKLWASRASCPALSQATALPQVTASVSCGQACPSTVGQCPGGQSSLLAHSACTHITQLCAAATRSIHPICYQAAWRSQSVCSAFCRWRKTWLSTPGLGDALAPSMWHPLLCRKVLIQALQDPVHGAEIIRMITGRFTGGFPRHMVCSVSHPPLHHLKRV